LKAAPGGARNPQSAPTFFGVIRGRSRALVYGMDTNSLAAL
jgi:hypothetical protein